KHCTNVPSSVDTFAAQFLSAGCWARQFMVQLPNGVVSRYPILAAGTFRDTRVSNRQFTWARIDVPGPHDLWAVSVHLLTTSSTERALEAAQLVAQLQQYVPAGDFIAVGGDYNTASRNESCITTLSSVLATAAPGPADQPRNAN